MFSILNGKGLDSSAKKIQDIVGFKCNKTPLEIRADLQTIANQMRDNIANGLAVETGLLKSGLSVDDTRYYAAIFAEIFTHELVFSLNTIRFITLICQKYHEEQVTDNRDIDEQQQDDGNDDYDYVETLPMTKQDIPVVSTKLADDLLIGSGILYRRFLTFVGNLGEGISIQSISTNNLQYGCTIGLFDRFFISIGTAYSPEPSATYGQFAGDFNELCEISQITWRMMSMFAFCDLFRFMDGTSYIQHPIKPDDAIFSNCGRPFKAQMGKPAISKLKSD
jgi:hypothetical protein